MAWIPHDGGPCPVDPETIIDAKLRNGSVYGPKRAKRQDWKHRIEAIAHLDTAAYRIVRPPTRRP